MIHDAIKRLAVPVKDLHPYHRNPRRGDVDLIRESLRANGQYRPIVVNKGTKTGRENEILAGNHTYHAAVAEGWEKVAVTFVDVDENDAAKIVLVDNRASDKAENDRDTLMDLLSELGPEDLEGSGYSEKELEDMLEAAGGGDPGAEDAWGVIVTCADEDEQRQLLERFSDEGLQVRALAGEWKVGQ